MPSPVGGLAQSGGLPPEKNQVYTINYAILSKFWYFFPILQHKVGDYPPVLKVGDLSPVPPPASTPMGAGQPKFIQLEMVTTHNLYL